MKVEHKKINFEDARGSITDIFVNNPKQHCTIIFSKKGAIRANHYHKISQQHDFIVSGKMECYGRKEGTEEIVKTILNPNDLVIWELGEAHEFIAIEDTIFITFVDGLRGGDDFEKDTYRLPVPLHEQMGK